MSHLASPHYREACRAAALHARAVPPLARDFHRRRLLDALRALIAEKGRGLTACRPHDAAHGASA